MPTACFVSKNLIGDALNISPALSAWYQDHQDWQVDLLTLPDHIAELYLGMGVPLEVFTDEGNLPSASLQMRKFEYDFKFTFDCSKSFSIGEKEGCHQAEAYAKMLGVAISSVKPIYYPEEVPLDDLPNQVVFLSMHSRSCSSQSGGPPNKMLPWVKWKPLLRYLRALGYPVRVLGADGDRADDLGFSEEEYWTGQSLRRVAWAMKTKAVLLVGIDNGMAHLAASQELPTFLLYPQCLSMSWIVPWGNPHVVPVHMDPATANPASLLWAMRAAVPELLGVRK